MSDLYPLIRNKRMDKSRIDAELIQKCGTGKLRKEMLLAYLPDVDREIRIAADAVRYGNAYCTRMYGVTPSKVESTRKK